MARKKLHRTHENHERWLVSYADFITLLFAFFVVMFASSHADKGRAEVVSESIRRALQEDQFVSAISGILGGTIGKKDRGNYQMKGPGGMHKVVPVTDAAPPVRLGELVPSLDLLKEELKAEIDSGMLQVHMEARGLVVSLREAAFFAPGDDSVNSGVFPVLERVAGIVSALPNRIRLEGHTDSVPIHTARFRSNWELSSARGVAMLRALQERFGVPASRMSVGGYAETVPVESNDTPDGRARNRRVDIVILNEYGVQGEPSPTEPSP
ncbi:MAG: OmpA family protein [Bryobacterales bacterium]|nr:OmpA family protein [Bryobacterales bacterium]